MLGMCIVVTRLENVDVARCGPCGCKDDKGMEYFMKKTDKILIGIVAGIVLLVVVAFVVALSNPKPAYQAEDTPEGVAFNYLFALQQKDYERAYGYLSRSIAGYPRDADAFTDDIRRYSWTFSRLEDSSITLEVESSVITGKRADVKIRETRFYGGELFNNGQSTSIFSMTLRQDGNRQWKIEDSDRYWVNCWNNKGGCK